MPSFREADDLMEVSKRSISTLSRETTTVNALIPRRDSKDLVPRPQTSSAVLPDGDRQTTTTKLPAYQAIVSPMPLLLDNLAVSITSVPTCLCEEDSDGAELSGGGTETFASSSASGNGRCYSCRPTPSELSINTPDCRDDDTDSANLYVYHNRIACAPKSSAQNGRIEAETDSITDLWQQVEPRGANGVQPCNVVGQKSDFPRRFPRDVIVGNRRFNEEKISSV